jgi:phosphatidylglycerophosphate synthase
VRAAFDQPFETAAKWLLSRGVHPNHFTFMQIPIFAGMIWAADAGQNWWFFGLSWAVIVLDGGDGILARVGKMESRTGAILDAVMDTIGIAVVLWGASQFFPEISWAYLVLFLLNGIMYAQNAVLEQKWVAYVRGPIMIPVVAPDTIVFGLFIALTTVIFLFTWRLTATYRVLLEPPAVA